MTHFEDEVGDDLVEDADGFGEGFGGEGGVRAWVPVGEKEEADCLGLYVSVVLSDDDGLRENVHTFRWKVHLPLVSRDTSPGFRHFLLSGLDRSRRLSSVSGSNQACLLGIEWGRRCVTTRRMTWTRTRLIALRIRSTRGT